MNYVSEVKVVNEFPTVDVSVVDHAKDLEEAVRNGDFYKAVACYTSLICMGKRFKVNVIDFPLEACSNSNIQQIPN